MGNAAIFLDRDDTIIEDPGYINDPEQVKLLPGAADALGQLKKMGYKLVVVTNQSAVARGTVSEEVLEEIHERLRKLLGRKRVYLDGIYYCPYHPEAAIPKYRRDSDFRKPNPGMLFQAAEELGIDLKQSWMIGNSYTDIGAGVNAGCRTILIRSATPAVKQPGDATPEKIAVNIKEAVNIIKMFRQQSMMTPKPSSLGIEIPSRITEGPAADMGPNPDEVVAQEEAIEHAAADIPVSPAAAPTDATFKAVEPVEMEPDIAVEEPKPKRPKPAAKKRPKAAATKRAMSPKPAKAFLLPPELEPKPTPKPTPEPELELEREPEHEFESEPRTESVVETRPQVAPHAREAIAADPQQVAQRPVESSMPRHVHTAHAPSTTSGRRFIETRGGKPLGPPPAAKPSTADTSATQETLNEVMRYLKKVDRLNMYDEFSWLKVVAGGLQVVVFFFLMLSVWFLMQDREASAVHTVLLYAAVVQLMTIAFYLMRDRR